MQSDPAAAECLCLRGSLRRVRTAAEQNAHAGRACRCPGSLLRIMATTVQTGLSEGGLWLQLCRLLVLGVGHLVSPECAAWLACFPL